MPATLLAALAAHTAALERNTAALEANTEANTLLAEALLAGDMDEEGPEQPARTYLDGSPMDDLPAAARSLCLDGD